MAGLPDIMQDFRYELRYQILAKSYLGSSLACLIYEQGYDDVTVDELQGSQIPYKRSLKSDEDQMEDRIFRSTIMLSVECTSETQYRNLMTSNARRYKACVTYIGEGYEVWGWVVPDQWTEPWTAPPFSVNILITDGLGELKTKDFVDNVYGDPLTGKHTLKECIHTILKKTNLNLHYIEAVNLYEENHDSEDTDTMLDQTYVDVAVFNDDNGNPKDCYNVLDEILKICGPAHLWQEGGYWYIVSMNNRKSSFTARIYDADFEYVSNESMDKEVNIQFTHQASDNFWFETPTLTILPGWKKFNLVQNFGFNSNIFDYDDEYTKNGDNMVISKDGTTQVHTINDEEIVSTRNVQYSLSIKRINDFGYGGAWLDYISYNLGVVSESRYSYLKVHYNPFLVDDDMNEDGLGINQWKIEIYIFNGSEAVWLNSDGKWKQSQGDMLDEELKGTVSDIPLDVTSDPVPLSGTLYLRVFDPFNNGYVTNCNEVIIINRDDLSVGIYNAYDILESLNITTKINPSQNMIPETFETILGDLPDLDNAHLMYLGGLYYLSGEEYEPTTRWNRANDGNFKNLVNLISDEISVNHVRPQWMISGELRANFTAGSLIHDSNAGRKFIMKRFEYDLYNNEWDIDAVELCLDSEGYLKLRTGSYLKTRSGGRIKLRNA